MERAKSLYLPFICELNKKYEAEGCGVGCGGVKIAHNWEIEREREKKKEKKPAKNERDGKKTKTEIAPEYLECSISRSALKIKEFCRPCFLSYINCSFFFWSFLPRRDLYTFSGFVSRFCSIVGVPRMPSFSLQRLH